MNQPNLQEQFSLLEKAIHLLQQELDVSYTEALAETLENLSFGGKAQVVDGLPTEEARQEIDGLYRQLKMDEQDRTTVRKLIQFAFIRAIKEDQLQPNHQMTPETIAFLVAHFLDRLHQDQSSSLRLLDMAAGTGNLLMTVMDHLEKRGNTVSAEAIDNDELLLGIAANSAHLEKWGEKIHFTHSDSVQDQLIEPADIAVADLPVGYYPMDERASKFETSFASGHSYAHFLLIEQHVKYLKEAGWGVFVVPANIFEEENSTILLNWLKGEGYLQAMLSLPPTLFRSQNMQKAILLIQKKGQGAKQAKEVLLGTIPDLKNAPKMQEFLQTFHNWSEKML